MNTNKISLVKDALKDENLDGWLFADFHNRDEIAYSVLGISPHGLTTRRWFYFIPITGEPTKIVHKIESSKLDSLPGQTVTYASYEELNAHLKSILDDTSSVAMQYSPMSNIPTVSLVDGGTIDLVKSFGVEIKSSANLVQAFEASVNIEGREMHYRASVEINDILLQSFKKIKESVDTNSNLTEYDIFTFILQEFENRNMTCDNIFPIVAINEHASDPHFEVSEKNAKIFKTGDRVMIDLWAKHNSPNGIFYDITWCAYIGDNPPEQYIEMFDTVVLARDKALNLIKSRYSEGKDIYGWEVDEVARNHINEAGYGEFFTHRTGHSINKNVHGNGVNMDNLETKDERKIVPGCCFSIEPGIYLAPYGVRSEINVLIHPESGKVEVFGDKQNKLLLL